jgi:RimJ/RimL family protein N-acetyltransferase
VEDGVVNPVPAVTLSDSRLILRRPSIELVPQIAAACQDRELHRWLESLPDPYTEADAATFVETCASGWADGSQNVFAITAAGGGRLLGMIGLHDIAHLTAPGGGMAEVGFWVVASERGQGIMPDALRLVCSYAFSELRLARIEWQAEVGNTASLQAAQKVGFRLEGTCRQRLLHVGERVDGWLGGLLPGELR